EAYTRDRKEPKLSVGVQGNILLKGNTLFVNGGAPVGIVALDALTGKNPQIVAQREAGMETFLEPDGKPFTAGPEPFSDEFARTTIFKRHEGRAYFPTPAGHVALVAGRLFCSRQVEALDRIVDLMNKDSRTGKPLTTPRDVMQVPLDDSILWASDTSDVCGLAVGSDGLVVLHQKSVEALALDGRSLWTMPLPATPVRWGVALTGNHCVVTLSEGLVVCLTKG
ncbi:MAG: hypothetical protein HQ582_15935, partial [Planctomycetes bacterium]|nr:hypothetical protein [Planctomycetota bacterium]